MTLKISDIQAYVANRYGLKPGAMTGLSRKREHARTRQIAMVFARKFTHHSLPAIGQKFGGRDHTTVLHAMRTIDDLSQIDPILRANMAEMERELIDLDASMVCARTLAEFQTAASLEGAI